MNKIILFSIGIALPTTSVNAGVPKSQQGDTAKWMRINDNYQEGKGNHQLYTLGKANQNHSQYYYLSYIYISINNIINTI